MGETLLLKTPMFTLQLKVGREVLGLTAMTIWQHICSMQYMKANFPEFWGF
jgi:hypothetical protein